MASYSYSGDERAEEKDWGIVLFVRSRVWADSLPEAKELFHKDAEAHGWKILRITAYPTHVPRWWEASFEIEDVIPLDAGRYKHKWRYSEKDRPLPWKADCYDCGLPDGTFPDMVIPDDLREEINPTESRGCGTLCPTCIANRLDYVGKWYAGDLFLLRMKDDAVFDVIEKDVIPLEPSHTADSLNSTDAPTRGNISR